MTTTTETHELISVVCPAEGCTAVQLMKQRQDEDKEEAKEHAARLENDLRSYKDRSTILFDKIFEKFDRLQWWLIVLLGGVVATLAAVLVKGG